MCVNKRHCLTSEQFVGLLSRVNFLAAKLVVESDNFGRVRIRSSETDFYLCVKRTGAIIGRKVTLVVYGHFIILFPKCLHRSVYSSLMVGLTEHGSAAHLHPNYFKQCIQECHLM